MADMSGRMVKRPGDKNWISGADMGKVMKIQKITCPDGKIAPPIR